MRGAWDCKRVWLPLVAAALCLLVAAWTGPIVTTVLVLASFAFILDGATMLFSQGGGGSLTKHRQ